MSFETVLFNTRESKYGRISLHALLWLTYFTAIFYLESISFNKYEGYSAVYYPAKSVLSTMLVYYPLVYFVWPKFLQQKKYILGLLMIVILVAAYATADHLMERLINQSCESCMQKLVNNRNGYYQLYKRGPLNVVLAQLVSFGVAYQAFVFLAFPLTIKSAVVYFDQRVRTIQLEQDNIRLEFNFLKSQVNPHFLFNTLNNIYALILKDEKDASAETVAKLASFMRYSLYESNTHSNNIMKEVDLLKVYLELERIRLNDTVVNFVTNIDNPAYTLPPLLLMPAVENAFKYCAHNSQGDAYIFMKLDVEGGKLLFTISNTFDTTMQQPKLHGGIGLQNLQKRLKHYYPNTDSSMQIDQDGSVFQLTIQLNLA